MEPTTMIMLMVGLSCEGETARMCRMFGDPAASRGTPALSSTPALQPASGQRSTNALRDAAARSESDAAARSESDAASADAASAGVPVGARRR